MKKKIFLIFLLMVTLLATIFNVLIAAYAVDVIFVEDLLEEEAFAVAFHESLVDEFGEEFIYNQMNAMKQVEELHNYFPVNRAGETMFPLFYGGSYICDEGHLVTLTVGEELPNRKFIFLDNIEMVNYSYVQLNQLLDLLAMRIDNPSTDTSNLVSARLDVRENRIVVELLILNDYEKGRFLENVLNHSAFEFVQAYDVPESIGEGVENIEDEMPTARNWSMPPGAALSSTLNGSINRSVGYRARDRNGQWGFVTALHDGNGGFLNLNHRFYSGTPRRFVGQILGFSRPHDAAFVRLPAGGQMSNVAMNGIHINPSVTNPVQGGIVTRVSAGTTASPLSSNGTIRSTNVVVNISGVSVQAVQVNGMSVARGDSGGVVIHRTTSPTVGGIIIAFNSTSQFYVHAGRINSALQLTMN